MEENVKRLVSELSADIVKNLKSKFPEVENARESLLTYVQDPKANIQVLEKKVKHLEDTLSQRNVKKTPVVQAIEKIREAVRVQLKGTNDSTESREDKGPPGSPAPTGKVTPVKGQGEEKQLSRPPGSPAPTGKVTPVKGQGEEKTMSRPPRSPVPTGKVTPVSAQGEKKVISRQPGSPAPTGKVTPVKGQGEEKPMSRPPSSPAPTGKVNPVKGQVEENPISRSEMVQSNEIMDQSGNKVNNTTEKEIRQLEAENKYLKQIINDLNKYLIDGETIQQKEEKLPEDVRDDQSILKLQSTATKVTNKVCELETELDFIYKRMSQLSPIIDGDKENAEKSPSGKVTIPGRESKHNPTTTKAPSERAMRLDKDMEYLSQAWMAIKEKEREAETRMRETMFLQSIINSLHKELHDASKNENRNDSSSPLDQVESLVSKDSSIYQSLTKAREISNIQVECKRLAEYATRLLEELRNFSNTRKDSNSIVLSEPPKLTSQNVDKKNLKKTEKLQEKSDESAFSEKLERNYENACHIHSQMKEKETVRVSLETKVGQLEVSNKRLNDIQDQNTDLKKEVDSLRLRLSELSGAKLSHENPDIADLSDPNRPTKLGEKYSEIYANQWTDAFVALSKQTPEHKEDDRILYLYNILVDGYFFCKGVRQTQIFSLEEIMFYPADVLGMETRGKRQKKEVGEIFAKSLSDAAKLSSNMSCENLVKAFLTNKDMNSKYREDMKLCEAYIKECVRLCWHMQVHTPPLCLDLSNRKGQPFVKDMYKEYSSRGKKIAFIVWPALFLHEKGPLITKGVAQGI